MSARPPGLRVRYAHDGEGGLRLRSERYPGRQVWRRFVATRVDVDPA